MKTEDFDYYLSPELIAQRPAEARDSSRLLVVDRSRGAIEHKQFTDLPGYLKPGDALVLNDTRVMKCRLFGNEVRHGGRMELFLVRELGDGSWEVLARPGKRAKPGTRISIKDGVAAAEVLAFNSAEDTWRVRIESDRSVWDLMQELGHVPLPPYIKRKDEANDEYRYQTVYAKNDGAVAAPTAGLHFTEDLIGQFRDKGVKIAYVTLHVGPGTFKPVRTSDPTEHKLDAEWFRLEANEAEKINRARGKGRAVCVGTTVARVMETVARPAGNAAVEAASRADRVAGDGTASSAGVADDGGASGAGTRPAWVVEAGDGWTEKYILPPYDFRIVDSLVTNFHLPKTTLLMLVSALAGRELILKAYEEAVAERYRFYSYGDAMLIL